MVIREFSKIILECKRWLTITSLTLNFPPDFGVGLPLARVGKREGENAS